MGAGFGKVSLPGVPTVRPAVISHPVCNALTRNAREPTRLLLQAQVECPSGKRVSVVALVDTGCEVNLVRRGLIQESEFSVTRNPLRFLAANKTVVPGGDRELECTLVFTGLDQDTKVATPVSIPSSFYDAEIGVDAIFAYEWMARSKIDIVPHRHGVVVRRGEFPVWVPGVREQAQPSVSTVLVRPVSMAPVTEEYVVRQVYVKELCAL